MMKWMMLIMCVSFLLVGETGYAMPCLCAYAVCIHINDKIDGMKK